MALVGVTTCAYTGLTIQRSAHCTLGSAAGCGQILVLTDFWQIRIIYAIVMMSETVGIDIHEIELEGWYQ